jgi:hypothetical protein
MELAKYGKFGAATPKTGATKAFPELFDKASRAART